MTEESQNTVDMVCIQSRVIGQSDSPTKSRRNGSNNNQLNGELEQCMCTNQECKETLADDYGPTVVRYQTRNLQSKTWFYDVLGIYWKRSTWDSTYVYRTNPTCRIFRQVMISSSPDAIQMDTGTFCCGGAEKTTRTTQDKPFFFRRASGAVCN